MTLGVLCIIGSTVVYAWIGLLSTKAVQVECPNCHKHTKVLGRVDMCMYCNEPLTLDPTLEGKEFDQSYNKTKNPSPLLRARIFHCTFADTSLHDGQVP